MKTRWPIAKISRIAGTVLSLLLFPLSAKAEEFLDVEHSHYRQQILRIQEALEKGKKEDEQQALINDAKRSTRWIFSEPDAAEIEKHRMGRRFGKEFFDLNLPILIHTLPARPVITQKTTAYSSLVTDFESGTITARVTVPFFEDKGLRKARNEAVFLSIILLRDGIMALPVRERIPLSSSVPPEAKISGGMIEQYIMDNGINPEGLSVKTNKLAAGGGIAFARISLPIPLHIGNRLNLAMIRTELGSPSGSSCRTTRKTSLPTGLILDLRGKRIQPFRDPILMSESRTPLMIPDTGRPSKSLPHGWAGWSDGQDRAAIEKRVGLHPLTIRPRGFLQSQIFVLSNRDAMTVCGELFPSKLISSGHMLFLVDPQHTIRPRISSKGSPS